MALRKVSVLRNGGRWCYSSSEKPGRKSGWGTTRICGISLCSLSECFENFIKEEPRVPASAPTGSPSRHCDHCPRNHGSTSRPGRQPVLAFTPDLATLLHLEGNSHFTWPSWTPLPPPPSFSSFHFLSPRDHCLKDSTRGGRTNQIHTAQGS